MQKSFDISGKKVWVAGHRGLVGSALVRNLQNLDCEILTIGRQELDLTRQLETEHWIERHKPDAVIVAAAEVGGIGANRDRPADFLMKNLAIAQNIIHAAYLSKISKLVFLGSSCIYPKLSDQPIREEALLSDALEPTNEAYAIAKIAGVKLCQYYRRQYGCDFISLMPCNIYGPGDRWQDEEGAHVIPSLIGKLHKAKMRNQEEMEIWGSGNPLREFLHADDLARGVILCLESYSGEAHLNIGSGDEISIRTLANLLKAVTGYKGKLRFDHEKPDGTPRKLLDSSRLKSLGWSPEIGLEKGLEDTYQDFLTSNPDISLGHEAIYKSHHDDGAAWLPFESRNDGNEYLSGGRPDRCSGNPESSRKRVSRVSRSAD